jgi:CRISPR-associated endoribonuclease Cas6
MPRRTATPGWAADTQLVGLTLTLQPETDFQAPSHFSTELHSWFLNQVRLSDPDLSAYLHDGQSEKAFTISSLANDSVYPTNSSSFGVAQSANRTLQFERDRTYEWTITALSKRVCEWLAQWLTKPPKTMKLRSGHLHIHNYRITQPATTYETIWDNAEVQDLDHFRVQSDHLTLSFLSPTSFRKRSNHMPLPIPDNVFQSYLRRWNIFAHLEVKQDHFLEWVNDCVVILRHELRSRKVQAGKQGSVTGFIGCVQFGLTEKAKSEPEYIQMVYALVTCAPYFGTGHKVTFGLGQTSVGWQPEAAGLMSTHSATRNEPPVEAVIPAIAAPHTPPTAQHSLLEQHQQQRHAELKQVFLQSKKRQGGERAMKTADLWATIISRQETGEKLTAIAVSLDLPYDTVKKYAQKARATLEEYKTE